MTDGGCLSQMSTGGQPCKKGCVPLILIDEPRWPAHGTLFSHLVSDSDMDELHAFARAHHISDRAFDLDHYDVPAELYDRLVAAGATALTGSELTRRLIASGLRVPLRERPAKIRQTLRGRFIRLLPHSGGIVDTLLDRWEEDHRAYHNSAHLLEVLTALDRFYAPAKPPRTVLLAVWFHDAVYTANPGRDETASSELAQALLGPLVGGSLERDELMCVRALIEMTADHLPGTVAALADLGPGDIGFFLDADMAILAADRARYDRYVRGVELEYSRLPATVFARGRVDILQEFLCRDFIYSTDRARQLYEEKARANLRYELGYRTTS